MKIALCFFSDINKICYFPDRFSKVPQYQISRKIPLVAEALIHADGRTDGVKVIGLFVSTRRRLKDEICKLKNWRKQQKHVLVSQIPKNSL
jgi:hypothetical protein